MINHNLSLSRNNVLQGPKSSGNRRTPASLRNRCWGLAVDFVESFVSEYEVPMFLLVYADNAPQLQIYAALAICEALSFKDLRFLHLTPATRKVQSTCSLSSQSFSQRNSSSRGEYSRCRISTSSRGVSLQSFFSQRRTSAVRPPRKNS